MISKKHQNFEEKKKKSSALNRFGLVSKARQCDSALLFWQEIGVCEGAACPSLLAQCVVHAAPDAAAAAVLAEHSSRNQPVRLGQALALCPCPVPPLMRGQLQAHEHLAFLCCLFRLRVDKSKASSGSGWCCCSATRVPPHAGDLCPSGASSCTSLSWLPGLLAQGGWVSAPWPPGEEKPGGGFAPAPAGGPARPGQCCQAVSAHSPASGGEECSCGTRKQRWELEI